MPPFASRCENSLRLAANGGFKARVGATAAGAKAAAALAGASVAVLGGRVTFAPPTVGALALALDFSERDDSSHGMWSEQEPLEDAADHLEHLMETLRWRPTVVRDHHFVDAQRNHDKAFWMLAEVGAVKDKKIKKHREDNRREMSLLQHDIKWAHLTHDEIADRF